MAGLQKTYSGDLTTSIAKQIIGRVQQSSAMASDERAYAEAMAEAGGTSLDEAGIGRGYFFRRALGSRFGGDAVARTRGRFEKNPPKGRDPRGTVGSRFRGGFDYRSSFSPNKSSPITPLLGGGGGPAGLLGGGGGINPSIVPNDTILGKMINVTPGRGRSGGITVHDEKLGKFVVAVGESLSASMNSMNTKTDGIDQGVIVARDGLTATQQQLEDVGSTLEDKLDAIIAEIRGQNALLRKQEDEEEVEKQEDKLEEQKLTKSEKSGTDRSTEWEEDSDIVKQENDLEDAAAIAGEKQQLMLPPAREQERGGFNTILHGKEQDLLTGKTFDGPDTGYKANTSGNIAPINNFFTRGQTGAASKTGGLPKSSPVKTGRVQGLANIPEIKKETDKLAKAAVLPVQASGAMTLGVLGKSMGQMDGLAGEKGVETGIKKIASPIAGMFGVKNSIANNVAGEVGSAADAAKRSASTAAGDAIKEGPFQGVFNALGNTVNWVKGLFSKKDAEKGGVVKTSSGDLASSAISKVVNAEKGAIINGPKTGYPMNIGGNIINAHGKEHVKKVNSGIQITPLDNFATDGIRGNEVTPGGDLNLSSKYTAEKGGVIPTRSQQNSKSAAAMSSPRSPKTDIVQINSKESEFNRMLTRVTKVDPIVINSADAQTTPPPMELEHISNKGDCALDMIYPPLV